MPSRVPLGRSRRQSGECFQWLPTQGKTPRGFKLDPTGRYAFAGNQDSNSVVVFKRNAATGRLTPTGQTVSVGSPVCIQFLPVE